MRLINADYLCDYANNTVDKTVDANDIMRMPYIEAVPLKPLAKWLAGYAMPPMNEKARAAGWEDFLRGMDWEADE